MTYQNQKNKFNMNSLTDRFIINYNKYATYCNLDAGVEIFKLIEFEIEENQSFFGILGKTWNYIQDGFAITFFSPIENENLNGVEVIGFNPEHNLFYCRNEDNIIYTASRVDDNLTVEYYCAPNQEVFIQLLMEFLILTLKLEKNNTQDKDFEESYNFCLSLCGGEKKYLFFLKVVTGIPEKLLLKLRD